MIHSHVNCQLYKAEIIMYSDVKKSEIIFVATILCRILVNIDTCSMWKENKMYWLTLHLDKVIRHVVISWVLI